MLQWRCALNRKTRTKGYRLQIHWIEGIEKKDEMIEIGLARLLTHFD